VVTPPLIIIGTKTESSPPPPKPMPTNPPATAKAAQPLEDTMAPVTPPVNPVMTNLPLQTTTQTNVNAPLASSADSGGKGFLIIGSGLFGAAIALGLVFWLRPRPKDPSLISRSMTDRK
jgi:hypothetical protein